uniref:Uncharacterized protein n=1 Tax=Rhizophora mucronata TaxID=61149 RepID=A0A2P2NNG4_RHIMU
MNKCRLESIDEENYWIKKLTAVGRSSSVGQGGTRT